MPLRTVAVVGLSGGIDSAVTAAVAAEALGPENVLGIAMPAADSPPRDLEDAGTLAAGLRIGLDDADGGGDGGGGGGADPHPRGPPRR
jgi:NH3-dependent NAD+ synthetase